MPNYAVYMRDPRGKNRVKIVKASSVKDAEGKAKKKYPSCEIGRISQDSMEIDFYSKYKK